MQSITAAMYTIADSAYDAMGRPMELTGPRGTMVYYAGSTLSRLTSDIGSNSVNSHSTVAAMKEIIKSLELTFGQVAWAICMGQPPEAITIDRLRHLRQLGVPFSPEEEGTGSGNRQIYRFDHLIECAIGIYAIRQRLKPVEVARMQVLERPFFRNLAREKFCALPQFALAAPWVKSRGQRKRFPGNEHFLRLHDKVSETPGKYDVVTTEELRANKDFSFGDLIERYPNGETLPLVPLERVMLQAVAWALEAPSTKPGPQ